MSSEFHPIRVFAFAAALVWAATASAQSTARPPVPLGSLPPLTTVRSDPSKSGSRFVEGLRMSVPDAQFEVITGHSRILTLPEDIVVGVAAATIAVGDPTIADFNVIGPRQIRIVGRRLGLTDMTFITAGNQTYTFEVQVVADLEVLRRQLRASFPDATLTLGHLAENIVVEGQARDDDQVAHIVETIRSYLRSVQALQATKFKARDGAPVDNSVNGAMADAGIPNGNLNPGQPPPPPMPGRLTPAERANPAPVGVVTPEQGGLEYDATYAQPQVINLIRVPGSKQVLLKVRVAELNRTGLRQIGANFLGVDPRTGAIVGSQIGGGSGVAANGLIAATRLTGQAGLTALGSPQPSTVFGIFQNAHFEFMLNAFRRNALLKVLAEPNLIAMSGQQASFLAGGEFPVPVPQVGNSGVASTVTIQFKKFGVQLDFLPFILDGDRVRLTVDPEVSQIDQSVATTLVAGGTPVPGLNTRRAHTTVELREGQTLAIAGLLQLQLDAASNRIPIMGELPIIGPFFSNTTSSRVEKELVVLVTPYLIEPMDKGEVPPGPGDAVDEARDLEFFLLGRIEGRTFHDFRSTTEYADSLRFRNLLKLESRYVRGPNGFSE